MSTSQNPKTRSERVANLRVERSHWLRLLDGLTKLDALGRLGLAVGTAILITLFVRGWEPPFAYREGFVPQRAILARVPFKVFDAAKTDVLRGQALRDVSCFYENNKEPFIELRGAAKEALFALRDVSDPLSLTKEHKQLLELFGVTALNTDEASLTNEQALDAIKKSLSTEDQISKFDMVMRDVLDPIQEHGLLRSLMHDSDKGNQRFIRVVSRGDDTKFVEVDVQRVRIPEVAITLRGTLDNEFKFQFGTKESKILSRMIHAYFSSQFPVTLSIRDDLNIKARLDATNNVKPSFVVYDPNFGPLVPIGRTLGPKEIDLLREEHRAYTQQVSFGEKLQRLAAFVGLITALYLLCGFFIHQSLDRSLICNTYSLFRLMSLCVIAVILSVLAANDPFRAEVIPVTLCAIIATISFGRPTALMLMAALSLIIAFSTRVDLSEFIILGSAAAGAILLCGRIRTRTRLVYVGVGVSLVVFMTVVGLGVMTGQTGGVVTDGPAVGMMQASSIFPVRLFTEAARQAMFILVCGPLMAGILPFVERIFDVQTDLSLLELSDMRHPLLRQLAQRAPGTYNHSISVAALAEAAAESIGAHGLLVRVGACFHDIGKMFKPNYFVENQTAGNNRHDTLQPAMSTLVIIAHVKDGADLARQHKLPTPVIDFIEQHHGTTLVEYFYRQATKRSEQDPHGEEISENAFRYPGPKPQTREAAVLMIADAVESASRVLVEPTASRLQNLVDQIAMKKLLDGQFDDCGLTLRELDTIKRSLVKSLTAIYHGRIKYPDQQSAG